MGNPRIVPLLFGLPASRRIAFRTVSQIGIRYRDSVLSDGTAGGVRGGDRLPWVPAGAGADNFAPLTALDWQAHVHGEPTRALADACADLRLPLHAFAWRPEAQHAGLRRDALYLIRPDGHVALADPAADPARLRRYLDERGGAGLVSNQTLATPATV